MVWYGIVGFNVPLDTLLYVISETNVVWKTELDSIKEMAR